MPSTETITCVLHPEDALTLAVSTEDGWVCALTRWYCEYEDEWYTGVIVTDPKGAERLHAGMTDYPMTRETALMNIAYATVYTSEE